MFNFLFVVLESMGIRAVRFRRRAFWNLFCLKCIWFNCNRNLILRIRFHCEPIWNPASLYFFLFHFFFHVGQTTSDDHLLRPRGRLLCHQFLAFPPNLHLSFPSVLSRTPSNYEHSLWLGSLLPPPHCPPLTGWGNLRNHTLVVWCWNLVVRAYIFSWIKV